MTIATAFDLHEDEARREHISRRLKYTEQHVLDALGEFNKVTPFVSADEHDRVVGAKTTLRHSLMQL